MTRYNHSFFSIVVLYTDNGHCKMTELVGINYTIMD